MFVPESFNQPSTFERASAGQPLFLTLGLAAATGPRERASAVPSSVLSKTDTVCVSVYVTIKPASVLRSPRSSLYSERGPLHDLYMTST